ncbi:pentalenene synthase [Streptomyces sp. NPDC056632]|uniref:terpene synthase family protein n=1 Tax=Streptomyces sp. NPDC056632 TaxID=3345884 RepID=UPI003680AD83
MPLESVFEVPFQCIVNPQASEARPRNLEWTRRRGLIGGPGSEKRFLFSEVAEVAAYSYPDARGEDLDLAYDLMGWFFLFDDQFDVPVGQEPLSAIAACEALIAFLHQPSSPPPVSPPAAPIVGAFADTWLRMSQGMSDAWCRRTVHAWVDYLTGNLTEAADRRGAFQPPSDVRLLLRRKTIGIRPSLALAERLGRYEVPPEAYHSSHLEAMRLITIDVVVLMNEVFSLPVDEARGDPNLVTCLMNEDGLSRQQAVQRLTDQASEALDAFSALEKASGLLCRRLALRPTGADAVVQYIDAMRAWMSGSLEWHKTCGRYSARAVEQAAPDKPGYLNTVELSRPLAREG